MAFLLAGASPGDDATLRGLIEEALKNSPEIQASLSRIEAAKYRIPQAGSLPDPQVSVGYQNEGFNRYTYGEEQGSQWMFSASQQFLFPGKRTLKRDMASRDVESLEAMHEFLRLKTAARVKELYFDLFLAYKNIELQQDKRTVLAGIEDLALARYAAGKAMQQEVLMAQTEKYMLLEKEEMLKQKIQSLTAMLAATLGRQKAEPVIRPEEPDHQEYTLEADEAVGAALLYSPEIKYRNKMVEAAEIKHTMTKKEYFPDFSISAGYYNRAKDFKDMWSAAATVSIPLYFANKQDQAVSEAKVTIRQLTQELEAAKLMITAAVRDNYSMLRSAEKLMDIYKKGLIPKNRQDAQQALSNYAAGKGDAAAVISRMKTLLDYETLYWNQFAEKQKAVARLHAITGGIDMPTGGKSNE